MSGADHPSPAPPQLRPRLVGIVNITEDSFSDGGRYLAADDALAHARRLGADGADVIELGPASSHPSARRVGPDEERRRLAPVLEALVAEGVPVSVDSFLIETHRYALRNGAAYLNDIHGFPDAGLYDDLAAADCRLIVMHAVQARGPATRVTTDPRTILDTIERFFADRLATLQRAGIDASRMVLDPGLGFFLGRNPEPSLIVMAGLDRLRSAVGLPMLVSPSRKSFLRAVTGRDLDRIAPATLAAELHAARQGVEYIRTHDVAALRDALLVHNAIAAHGS